MSRRIEKVNKHIQRTLGGIIQREVDIPNGVMVTISHVETAPNLQSSTIWLYITPSDRESEVLSQLRQQLYDIQGTLNRKLRMHPLPRITFRCDHGLTHAEHINTVLNELEHKSTK